MPLAVEDAAQAIDGSEQLDGRSPRAWLAANRGAGPEEEVDGWAQADVSLTITGELAVA